VDKTDYLKEKKSNSVAKFIFCTLPVAAFLKYGYEVAMVLGVVIVIYYMAELYSEIRYQRFLSQSRDIAD
jgi:uncharacterized membrane protein